LAVTPDQLCIVSGSADKTVRVWKCSNGSLPTTLLGHEDGVCALGVTPDGRYIASAGYDRTVRLWELRTSSCVRAFPLRERSPYSVRTPLAITPNGKTILSESSDGVCALYDLKTGAIVRSFGGHTSAIVTAAVAPDGKCALTGSLDQTVKLWDLDSGSCLQTFLGHAQPVEAVAISPDGLRAISSSSDRSIRVWDLSYRGSSETKRAPFSHVGEYHVTALALTPDGRYATAGSGGGFLRVWQVDTGRERACVRVHSQRISELAITPDGRFIVSTDDVSLNVWGVETGKQVFARQGDFRIPIRFAREAIRRITDLSHGNWEVVMSADHKLLLVNAATGLVIKSIESWGDDDEFATSVDARGDLQRLAHDGGDAPAIALTANMHRGVSGSGHGVLTLWDTEKRTKVFSVTAHTAAITDVAVTPDGRVGVSASRDAVLKVWNLTTGECLSAFTCESPLFRCAVSHDARTYLAGELSGCVHILHLVLPGDPIQGWSAGTARFEASP
jgi:WD40 repeat protein